MGALDHRPPQETARPPLNLLVTLGRNLGTEVEVITGLTQADRVVNSPADSLASGDIVRVASQTGVGGDAGQAGAANEATAASGDKEQH